MSKRGAANYLTDQNWDKEEEEEEAGVFKQADSETLQRRPIKRAVRRKAGEDATEEGSSGSTFKGFTGFAGFQNTSNASTAFSNLGSKPLSFSNGASSEPTKPVVNDIKVEKKDSPEVKDAPKPVPLTNGNGDAKSPSTSNLASPSRSKYLHQLKSLNEGVSKWIKDHVDKNPYCILTPIFKDYETYLADLDKKYPPESREKDSTEADVKTETVSEGTKESSSPVKSTPSFSFTATSVTESVGFKPTSSLTTTTSPTTTAPPVFSFGTKSLASSTAPLGTSTIVSSGIFGTSSTGSGFSGFKFGSSSSEGSVFGGTTTSTSTTGFTFGTAATKPKDGGDSSQTDEEYVPPKIEVSEVKEEDSLYSKRCKLFFKKDEQWKEKGVGNLHLKPCGEKTQLLVRADTNLGNILLNIMLNTSVPLTRQGKNNVALVCIPNPAIDGIEEKTMVPMLIRVKTSDDADELFDKLKEYKETS